MDFIKNLKIRHQLLTLLFLLLIPLIYFTFILAEDEIQENRDFQKIILQLTESQRISEIIHQFQKERARLTIASEGDSLFFYEALAQRELTDASIASFKEFLENTEGSFSDISLINGLQEYRNQLDQGHLNQLAFRDFSRGLIFSLLNRLDENATRINNPTISAELNSFKNLVEAKIQLGRTRTLMMNVIKKRSISYEDYASFIVLKTAHDKAMNRFKLYAPQEGLKEIQNILGSESYKEMMGLFQMVERTPQADLSNYNTLAFFNLVSKNLELLKSREDVLISRIKGKVEEESRQKEERLITIGFIAFLTLGLASLLSVYIINLISSSLLSLKKAADRVKLGDTDVVIDIEGKNEIGIVADSFRGVVKKNKSLTKVAQSIGNGTYDVAVEIQGPEDRLSYAIKEMKDSLQRFTSENHKRNWILSGVSELNTIMTDQSQISEISQSIIRFICNYANAQVGLLYLHNDAGQLIPSAAYGVPLKVEQLPAYALGTGQVGQAVSEQKIKILKDIPEEYLKIKSGLAEITPATIIIIPLQFADTTIGAIELSTQIPYSDLELEFLKSASERISIALHTLKSHFKTQELLYETQNQAEELVTQQEELRELNAELKASEEELKVSQEELQEKNAELEEKAQLLEEQYEDLRIKNNAIEEAREAIEIKIEQVEAVSKYKSEFLANMSHELRTPLNSILILSRLLADNPENKLNEKQEEHARIIHKSGSDLLRLINEILDLSKIESGMIRLETEKIDIQKLDLESTFRELARDKDIDFSIEANPDGIGSIITDRFRLEQILKNFLNNAIKFTDAGGKVALSIYPVKEKMNFNAETLTESNEIMAFAVKDTGIGIPKDKQMAIFEAFQQADSSTTRKYGGTGLGLAISKELANLLGGEIMLESEEGVGSTFTLFLPATPPQTRTTATAAAVEPAQKQAVLPQSGGHQAAHPQQKSISAGAVFDRLAEKAKYKEISVLIIEDDKAFNDILADFAHAKNFKVRQAYTGQEGLELARAEKPEAIMLDIHLPDISGWEVLKEIREDSELRHVNVHVMSAYDKEVVGKSNENEEYLPKPVTLEMLNTAFNTISSLSDSSIETIMIVEDNEIENNAIAELLLAHSLQSISAYSAEEAEQLLAKNKIDCIILDLNLPGMKGYEWMGKIRATKGLSEIPIIIYSGKDLSEEEEIKLKKFANTIIIKNEYSYLRLLDEVQLFLHKVNQKLPLGNDFKMKLHVPEKILQGKKVLLVDDDIRNVYSLSNLLELQGMKIVEAYNGKEALAKLQTEDGVDIVLMDVMMPEMDGMEAMRQIRKMNGFKDLPIIALTAKAMKEDKEKCIAAGASDYIPKPVDTDKLLTLMRIWVYEA